MGKNKNRPFENTLEMNMRTYTNYYERLMELAMSCFKWYNLPDSIDARFMELTLLTNGACVFFHDEELGYLGLPVAYGGKLNVYRIPTKRRAYASTGYNKELDESNSVIIFNNIMHTNSINGIELYAQRLYELERIIDVNTKAQKTPALIKCPESQRLTLLNLYKEYDGNQPVIFGSKQLDLSGITCVSTGAPYIADRIYDMKVKTWNEALTYLGITNVSVTKKERLVSDEVNRNQGGTMASRFSRLDERQRACEKINAMFGLDIWCDFQDTDADSVEVAMP